MKSFAWLHSAYAHCHQPLYTMEDNQSLSILSFASTFFFITYLRHEFPDAQHSTIDVNVSSVCECRWRCNHFYTLMQKYDKGINIAVPTLWSLSSEHILLDFNSMWGRLVNAERVKRKVHTWKKWQILLVRTLKCQRMSERHIVGLILFVAIIKSCVCTCIKDEFGFCFRLVSFFVVVLFQ